MSESGSNVSRLRNPKACEACRASKSRCFFRNQQDVCQRCEQSGNQCIVRTKARPIRAKVPVQSVRSWHAWELEPQLPGHVPRAIRGGQESALDQLSRAAESEFSINLPTVTAPDTVADVEELHQHHKDILVDENGDRPKDGETCGQLSARISLIDQRKIDLKQAEELLLAFRSKAPFFPFVHIPLEASVPSLSRNSPFLLLAILTVASSRDPKLHHQMDHEFRRILSSKVVVEGQKTLDFMQGILVYIAWYPMHSNPKNNQAFIYINLATSIAVDLGLGQEYPNKNVLTETSRKGLIENSSFSTSAKRAYSGCYYLSSSLSMGFHKPNNLPYHSLMDNRGEVPLQPETDDFFCSTDITSLVKLQRLTERTGEVHQISVSQAGGELHDGSLLQEMNIQMFLNELQEWRTTTSFQIQNLPFVGLADRFANIAIYSHELGFLRRPYRDVLKSADPNKPANQSHLFSCLDACKRFFEYLISIPELNYTNFTSVQWTSVVQSTLILSRLTFLMASTLNWTSESTRANIPLVMYLDALCYRFQAISTTPPPSSTPPKDPDFFHVFALILSSVKKSYERRVAAITPKSFVEMGKAVGSARGHCPMLDPNLAMYLDQDLQMMDDSTYGGSWGYVGESTPSNGPSGLSGNVQPDARNIASATPVYFDLWATMTGSWAVEF